MDSAAGSLRPGMSDAPKPLDYPFVEFDLLTGDLNGPMAPGGFTPQVDWNIFRFHRIPGDKTVVEAFEFPIKLNRKNFKYRERMDEDEEMEIVQTDANVGVAGPAGAAPSGSGLLDGLDLQDLKNVTVPSSASQIGQSSVKQETPGASGSGTKKNEKLVPLKGPDGQVVYKADGEIVMVTPAVAQQAKGGRLPYIPGVTPEPKGKKGKGPQRNAPGASSANGGGKGGDGKPGEGRRRGGKKTRQVFLISEEARKLKKEERYPWLWEDASGQEVWEGRRTERNKVKMQLLQVCKDGKFRWYPARKHYMFTKLPTWEVLNADMANEQFERDQRRRNPLYFAQNTNSEGFTRAFRQLARQQQLDEKKAGGFVGEATMTGGASVLRLVDRGRPTAFDREEGDDIEDADIKRENQEREQEIFGMEGDMDEMEYDEEMADDDEKVHIDGKEEEEKEVEERLKREWRQANKTDVEIADHTFMGRQARLDKAGRKIKRMLRGQDKTGTLYETDSDKDPYASQEDSDSDTDLEEKERKEKEKAEKEKAEQAKKEEEEQLKQLLEEKEKEREAEKERKNKAAAAAAAATARNEGSAPNKVITALGGKGGGSSLKPGANASRATSPKPKQESSRSGSPAIRSSGTPAPSSTLRATSPMPKSVHGRTPSASGSSTPTASGGGAIKRKTGPAGPSGGEEGPHKRQRTASPTDNAARKKPAATPTPSGTGSGLQSLGATPPHEFPGCLTREMVYNFLKEREMQGLKTTTKDPIDRFKHMWSGAKNGIAKEGVDVRNKELLAYWVRNVANLSKENGLVLKKDL